MMLAIKCKSGKIFAGCVKEFADDDWKREELYYQQQGCIVEEVDELKFEACDCEHSKSLLHDFKYEDED